MTSESGLRFQWSPVHHPEWDATPEAYVGAGVVGWGRSRRLARVDDATHHFKAYLGVHHSDPARWGLAGASSTKFFLSIFVDSRLVAFRTFPTMSQALANLRHTYERILARHDEICAWLTQAGNI
jgi:hypothetical protein